MRDTRRQFSSLQKDKLFILYDGTCGICGELLDDDWEADHIQPWSLGGPTTIKNGQPACKLCNKQKGSSFMQAREWQVEFTKHYFSELLTKTRKSYLLVATPGSGKTTASLLVAKRHMEEKTINKIIVVCPTDALKTQWADHASEYFGVALDPNYKETGIGRDFQGICVTYGKVMHRKDILNKICTDENNRVLVILDELHHAGDMLPWGSAIQDAFINAYLVLGLSGTPFRGDNNTIPFVVYDESGIAVPDFIYGYSAAIMDKVCRKLMFPSLDGGAEFYYGDELKQWQSFTDTETEEDENQLLRAILKAQGNYLFDMLTEADYKLDELRSTDFNAGGLVVCKMVDHANEIAKVLHTITGHPPVVVHSDSIGSSKAIGRFVKSKDKWIVAVKMISEGIDIPRLRVGVYATNIQQELTFRQVVARVVRYVEGKDNDWAYFYVPLAPKLVEYMKHIKAEIVHAVDMEKERKECSLEVGNDGDGIDDEPQDSPVFLSLNTDRNAENDLVISDSESFNLTLAKEQREKVNVVLGYPVNEWQAAKLVEIANETSEVVSEERKEVVGVNPKPVYKVKKDLKSICNSVAWSVAASLVDDVNGTSVFSKQDVVKRIHSAWSRQAGNNSQPQADIEELERKLKWLGSGIIESSPSRYLK